MSIGLVPSGTQTEQCDAMVDAFGTRFAMLDGSHSEPMVLVRLLKDFFADEMLSIELLKVRTKALTRTVKARGCLFKNHWSSASMTDGILRSTKPAAVTCFPKAADVLQACLSIPRT